MINNELDNIMSEYVDKAKKFCEDYKKAVLAKEHTTFSRELEKIYGNLENELWHLKYDTEELLYISNDRFINREINRRNNEHIISINGERAECLKKEIESVQNDLNSIHRYFLYRYGADIAEGLAEQWGLEAVTAGFEVVKSGVKYVIREGMENDD